jgi:hypothetical protein
VELRNCIVHYKAKPTRLGTFEGGFERLERELEDLDLDDLLDIPDELEDELNSALIELDQDLQSAIEVYQTIFESTE